MKRSVKIFISIGAILFIGLVVYVLKFYEQKADIWKLIPGNAVLAYENQNIIDNWNGMLGKPVWNTLQEMPYFSAWKESLEMADSLSGKDGSLDKLFRNKTIVTSVHIVSSKKFDFLFFLDLNDDGNKAFQKIRQAILKNRLVKSGTRVYQDYTLQELKNKNDNGLFTYFIHKGVLIGSYTPFLVEDVIRNIESGYEDNFGERITSLGNISKLENDEGNIYLDFGRLPDLLSTFLLPGKSKELKDFAYFAGDTYLDLKITEHELLFNGSSIPDPSKKANFIATFENQNPGRIKITELLPNRTAVLYHFTFSDFKKWQDNLLKYWSVTDNAQFQAALSFSEEHELSYDWVGNEAAMALLETEEIGKDDQLIFVKVTDKYLAFEEMRKMAEKVSESNGDSLYVEIFNEQPIIQLPFVEFPTYIFGKMFSGFDNSFITLYDDYLIIGNKMQTVKYLVQEVEDENIWGKSVRQNIFLENTLGEANFSIMLNTELCWKSLLESLNEDWKSIFTHYERELKAYDRIAFQISNLDNRFYTSAAISHQPPNPVQPKANRLDKLQAAFAISDIVTKPYIVRNHNNNKFETMVQDANSLLYQISPEGEILWADSIRERITTDIYQIDYYKNSKLQYLFATANKIHLLDRNGDYVENYPIRLDEGVHIEHLNVIDYDNSKKYRFMAVDTEGNIYLYDKEKNLLDGWNPKKLGGRLSAPGYHVRVKGGDCMIAMQEKGVLNVMNRRGEMMSGFPIDVGSKVSSPVFCSINNDFESTRLITVTDNGEIIEVNLLGKVLKREQLVKPTKESSFRLVADALGKNFVIIRQEYNKISILDRNGEMIMGKELITSGNLIAQYYNFSSSNQIFIVTDLDQEFSYVYDSKGELITFEPLESSFPVGLLYISRDNEYFLYKCYHNSFSVSTFK